MIPSTAKKDEKLRIARKKFVDWTAHWRRFYEEAQSALRYYHNSEGTGQWRKQDLEYLRRQGRAALTMNIIHTKIDNVVGMNEENRQETRAAPIGGEDQPVADLVNAVVDRIDDEVDNDTVEAEAFEDGAITGEANVYLDVRRDRENPEHIAFEERAVSLFEVKWDPSAELPDASDAKGVFWDRWVPRTEFMSEYPEHAAKVDELRDAQSDSFLSGRTLDGDTGMRPFDGDSRERDYDDLADSRWFDKRRDEIRVIHFEYVRPVRRYFAAPPGRTPVAISEALGKKLQADAELRGGLRILSTWDEEWWWLDFVANEVLFDDRSPQPYQGPSLTRYRFFTDTTTGSGYGLVRNLRDPQQDVNKAFSQSQDHVGSQAKPGYLAEKAAFDGLSVAKFEEDTKVGGTVALVADGALTAQKIIPRTVPEFSVAAAQRLQTAIEMADRVSGIYADLDRPSAHAEAATTVGLRERKSLRSMIGPLRRFQRVQKAVKRKKIEAVVDAMPDDQVAEKLGNAERFQVTPEGVVDRERQVVIPFRSIRQLRYDVELQAASTNQTERLVLLQVLMELGQTGQPVDPEVIFELAAQSRAMRERLTTYARNASEVAQQTAAQQEQTVAAQLQATTQIEASKAQTRLLEAQEKARHNVASETLQAGKQMSDAQVQLVAIWEKADEKEKAFILEMAALIDGRQARREGVARAG